MRAMVWERRGEPLTLMDVKEPEPGEGQVLIRVRACGVCRTDVHIVDGELAEPKLPLVLGHQIVGTVEARGAGAERFPVGARVGVAWLGWSDGTCKYCATGRENLCDNAKYTGYDIDGGFAEKTLADERFIFPTPDGYGDLEAAPLLCGGLIGYRALRFCGDARRLGLYGFGSAAHMIAQVARHEGREVYAFVRKRDEAGKRFAREFGAAWAGESDERPPVELDAAIIFAPVGALVPAALRAVGKGGVVVCAGIHMSDIPSFPYAILWGERAVRSVANLTRRDGEEFLKKAAEAKVRTEVHAYPLERANEAIDDLREGRFTGSAVVVAKEGQGVWRGVRA
jgi:propanol-preferring alcohol dehydrogenase